LTGQGHGHGGYLIIAGGGGGASEGAPGGAGGYNKGQNGGSDCNTTQCFSTGGKGGSNHRGGGSGTSGAFGHRFGTIYSAQGISEGDGSVTICWN
jgi:hypothetical protein